MAAINEYISLHQKDFSNQLLTSAPSIASGMFLSAVPPPPTLPIQASLEGFSPKASNLAGIAPRNGKNASLKKSGNTASQRAVDPKGGKVKSTLVENNPVDIKLQKKKEKVKRKKNVDSNIVDIGLNNTTEVRINVIHSSTFHQNEF